MKPEPILMLGVSGMGMAPMALYLQASQWEVWGYDDHMDPHIQTLLQGQGVQLMKERMLPPKIRGIVYTNALDPKDPLLQEAQKAGLWVKRRGEFLAQIAAQKESLVVIGSHGKTTTTGLITYGVFKGGYLVDCILGGMFKHFYQAPYPPLPAAYHAHSEWIVLELDESDGTIDAFSPDITLVLNFDWDHASQYPRPDALLETFGNLFSRTKQAIWVPEDSPVLQELAKAHARCVVQSYGENGHYDVQAVEENFQSSTLELKQGFLRPQTVHIPLGGHFNLQNAKAACVALNFLTGCAFSGETCFQGFPGIERRQQCLLASPTLTVYEDYAHHPTEIEALYRFFEAHFPHHHRIVVFEPHRYSRTLSLKEEFIQALSKIPHLYLLEVYGAFEEPLPEADTASLIRGLHGCGHLGVEWFSKEALTAQVKAQSPVLVLFVGAGPITKVAKEWVQTWVKTHGPTSRALPGVGLPNLP